MSRANKDDKNFLGSLKKGALRRTLKIPEGKKIPVDVLKKAKRKAEKSGNELLNKRATLALNMRKWNKK